GPVVPPVNTVLPGRGASLELGYVDAVRWIEREDRRWRIGGVHGDTARIDADPAFVACGIGLADPDVTRLIVVGRQGEGGAGSGRPCASVDAVLPRRGAALEAIDIEGAVTRDAVA